MNRPLLLTVLAAILTTGLLMNVPNDSARKSAPWADQQQAKLENALLHAAPGSDRALKLQLKLDRLEAWRQDQPQPGFPDQFAQVLYDMRVPSDRVLPEYKPGYRFRELDKAPRSIRSADKSVVWNQRGPGNVAGRARGIIVDPGDATGLTWFIAAVGGGVWYTADGGSTWAHLTDDMPNLAIQSLAMAASNPDVIYAGTGESFYNVDTMNGNGIIKSTDRGVTWAPLASTVGGLNMDGMNNFGPTRDVTVTGLGMSELDAFLAAAAAGQERVLEGDRQAEKGYFYRSDHFELAKKGVPMIYPGSGYDHDEKGVAFGMQKANEYVQAVIFTNRIAINPPINTRFTFRLFLFFFQSL